MSFWNLSDGESAVTGEKEYEQETGNFAPIPDGSNVLAVIEEAKWDHPRESVVEFISIKWSIAGPPEFLNRKIYHKLWVTDDDPNAKDADKAKKKRDRAKKMLATIDANCGGKLARKPGRPSDDDLALALTMKPMVIKCMVWEMESNGQTNSGNWVAAVFPKDKGVSIADASPPKAKYAAPAAAARGWDDDSDVPF